MTEHRLCYVAPSMDGDRELWFTSQPVVEQWGDDWNDAPYEHNAGRPYDDLREGLAPAEGGGWKKVGGTGRWTLRRFRWWGNFDEPCDVGMNAWFCVQEINAGRIAWLWKKGVTPIFAGMTVEEVRAALEEGGGGLEEVTDDDENN